MKIIGKSIRQMLRTPVRSVLFLLLLVLAAALLALGAGLYLLSAENARRLDEVFVTIGTVQQKPTVVRDQEVWNWEKKEYVSRGPQPEYGTIVPVEVLYFEDAGYIHPPVRRPYYGAYHPDLIARKNDNFIRYAAQMREAFPVLELEPVEDCVPNHPVRMQIKRSLYGRERKPGELWHELGRGWDLLWLCDHYNPNPEPLFAGKTYIMALNWQPEHQGQVRFSGEFHPIDITSTQYRPNGERIPDSFPMDLPWEEVTEGFYDTPRGHRWLELGKALDISEQTIPVVPTDSTELLMSFYNGNSNVITGRDITEEEYQTGQRVCLISQEFAKLNGLSVEDKLPLHLYYADYRDSSSRDFSPDGWSSLGVPESLLNARGGHYEVFEKNEYAIVGIYNETNKVAQSTGYDMGGNAVVIPAGSVKNSDENNILDYGPMMGYNTVFQIPNGTIEQFMNAWEKQGIDDLEITFYDRGYTQLKEGLDKIKEIALALFAVGICNTILILLFFCQLFIGKQKKRTAIEHSLGMSKADCTLSLLSGILVIVLLGSGAGSAAGYFLTDNAMNRFAGRIHNETFDTSFSNWANASEAEPEIQSGASSANPL